MLCSQAGDSLLQLVGQRCVAVLSKLAKLAALLLSQLPLSLSLHGRYSLYVCATACALMTCPTYDSYRVHT